MNKEVYLMYFGSYIRYSVSFICVKPKSYTPKYKTEMVYYPNTTVRSIKRKISK